MIIRIFSYIAFLLGAVFFFLGFSYCGAASTNVSSTVTTSAQATLTQNAYRWYENLDSLTPTTAEGAENASVSTPAIGNTARLRINLSAAIDFSSGLTFKLQYSTSTSGGFSDLGSSAAWAFSDNPGVADGQNIVTTLLSGSNVGESYGESNPSAATPLAISTGQTAEWDWVVTNNSADTASNWYFRMVFASGTVLDSYSVYPGFTAVATATTTPTSTTGNGGRPGGQGSPLPTSTIPKPPVVKPILPSPCDDVRVQQVDLNNDCKVDIVDLSILLYYYGKGGERISRFDFDDSGAVDFPDVSIMMFYWTN